MVTEQPESSQLDNFYIRRCETEADELAQPIGACSKEELNLIQATQFIHRNTE